MSYVLGTMIFGLIVYTWNQLEMVQEAQRKVDEERCLVAMRARALDTVRRIRKGEL